MTSPVRLHAHAKPLRRGSGEVQFGLGQDGGIVLSGLAAAETDLLCALGAPQSLGQLSQQAAMAGLEPDRLHELLDVLDRHSLLVQPVPAGAVAQPAATSHDTGHHKPGGHDTSGARRAAAVASSYRLPGDGRAEVAARQSRAVLVCGGGLLAELAGDHLRRAGIGSVRRSSWGAEPPGDGRPDLVILLARAVLPVLVGERCGGPGAHLPVLVSDRTVVVGPLVEPTRGPCLRCLDLHRRDRDTAWPDLAAQLADESMNAETDPVLAAAGAALTAMVAQAWLDGAGVPTGLCWELRLPWPEVITRVWVSHPRCPAQRHTTDPGWSPR